MLQSVLVDLVKSRLGSVLEPKQLSDLLTRLASLCEVFGTKGRKYVDQERFLTLMLNERPLDDDGVRPLFRQVWFQCL